jgi:hypothetical protein
VDGLRVLFDYDRFIVQARIADAGSAPTAITPFTNRASNTRCEVEDRKTIGFD